MSTDKLETIVSKRLKREKISWGEIFIFWGILNLVGIALSLVIGGATVWLVLVPLGILAQSLYVHHLRRSSGYLIFYEKAMTELWLFMLILLPVLFYVFPFWFGLYAPRAIMSMVTLWLALALFMSGMLTRSAGIAAGAAPMLAASVLIAFFPDRMPLIFMGAVVLGLIVPGMWSRHAEKIRV